jgi:hypothetical protein
MPRAAIRRVPPLAARIPNTLIRAITPATRDPHRSGTVLLSNCFGTPFHPGWSTAGRSGPGLVEGLNSWSREKTDRPGCPVAMIREKGALT